MNFPLSSFSYMCKRNRDKGRMFHFASRGMLKKSHLIGEFSSFKEMNILYRQWFNQIKTEITIFGREGNL
jgi:hypothetical protein